MFIFRWIHPLDKLWERSVSVKERLDFKKFLADNKSLINVDVYYDDPGVFLQKILYSVYKSLEIRKRINSGKFSKGS